MYLQVLNLKLQLPNRALDLLEATIYHVGINVDISARKTRKVLYETTLIKRSNMTKYVQDLVNAGAYRRTTTGEVYLVESMIPSIVDGCITTTIEIYAGEC